ncbi:hypothetical protein [Flavobacterium sp.]
MLQKTKVNKQGKCPIRYRITFNEGRCEFSYGQFVKPDNGEVNEIAINY